MKRAIILGFLFFCIGLTEEKCEGPPKWQHSRAEGSVLTNQVLDVREGLSNVKVEGDHGSWTYDRGAKNLRFMISEDEMKSMDDRGNLFNSPMFVSRMLTVLNFRKPVE